jgi:hypothetical protein
MLPISPLVLEGPTPLHIVATWTYVHLSAVPACLNTVSVNNWFRPNRLKAKTIRSLSQSKLLVKWIYPRIVPAHLKTPSTRSRGADMQNRI